MAVKPGRNGLEISIEKSVVMKRSQNHVICREIKCNGNALKVADNLSTWEA
jgi:hypothetical protein